MLRNFNGNGDHSDCRDSAPFVVPDHVAFAFICNLHASVERVAGVMAQVVYGGNAERRLSVAGAYHDRRLIRVVLVAWKPELECALLIYAAIRYINPG